MTNDLVMRRHVATLDLPRPGRASLVSPSAAGLLLLALLSSPVMATARPFEVAASQLPDLVGLEPRSAMTPQGSVELLAASSAPAKTGDVWLALRFKLNPGWHIYWRNPGDSGGPPVVEWHVPKGAKMGELVWPTPSRIPLESLINYGYEEEVVLPMKLSVPPATAGRPFRVSANLKWLVCKDICVAGKASVGLDLPVGPADGAAIRDWAQAIETARSQAPQPAPRLWRTTVAAESSALVLTVRLDRPAPASAVFFPLEVNQIDNAAPQEVTAKGQELHIRLKKSDRLANNPTMLRGVLAFPSGPSVTVAAPIERSRPRGFRE